MLGNLSSFVPIIHLTAYRDTFDTAAKLFGAIRLIRSYKMSKKTKTIIVGAGAAGIAAASKLLQNGMNDFVILEANNRIGGRVHTVDFGK